MNGMNRITGRPLAGDAHLVQSIGDILGTPVGSRVGRRDYGSRVPGLLDQPNNPLGRIRIIAAAAQALLRQEERCRIERITLSAGEQPFEAVLTITARRTDGARRPFSAPIAVRARSALSTMLA